MTSDPMSFADAAFRILQSAGEPLHYQEITRRSLEQGFLQTDGKTPDATLNARLAVDIKQKGNEVYIIEVNDNPSIETAVEDKYLGNDLYDLIMKEFRVRLDAK